MTYLQEEYEKLWVEGIASEKTRNQCEFLRASQYIYYSISFLTSVQTATGHGEIVFYFSVIDCF